MAIEFVSLLKPGPVYVGTLLEEMGDDIRKIVVVDDDAREALTFEIIDDWKAVVPVYILNKEVKVCGTEERPGVGRCLVVRV